MGQIVTIIVGIIEVVPMIKKMFDQIFEVLIQKELSAIQYEQYSTKDKRDAVYMQIPKAKTNEERKILSVIVADLTR